MAKKLTDFLKQLATKAGMTDDATLTAIVSNEALGSIEIPDEFFTGMDNKLLSLSSALDNHPDIRKKYQSDVFGTIDAQLKAYLNTISELDETTRSSIMGETGFKKLPLLFNKLDELRRAKDNADTDKDKVALQKKIDKLHLELQEAKSAIEKTKNESDQKLNDYKIDYRLRGLLNNAKTTLDSLPADVRQDTILNIVNKHLQGNGLVLKFDEKGDLQPYNSDGSKHYGANHTVTTMPALIDSLLAQNKLIPVSNSQNGQTQNHNNGQQNNGHTVIDTGKPNGANDQPQISGTNQAVANMNAELLKSLTATPSN